MQQRNEQPHVLTDAWEILLRHRWRFVLPAFVIMVAVLSIGLMLPRKYSALAVFERRTDMVLAEMSTKSVASAFEDPRHLLHDAIAGPAAVDRLLNQLEPELRRRGWVQNQTELRNLRSDLLHRVNIRSVVTAPTLDRIRVEYTTFDPALAQLVCNTLVENYIAQTRQMMNNRLTRSAGFFREQVKNSRNRIEQTDTRLLEFEIKHAALLPRNLDTAQNHQSELESQLAELVSQRDAVSTQIQFLTKALDETPTTLPTYIKSRNPELTRLEQRQRDLSEQIHRGRHTLRMTDQHPEIISLKEQLAQVQARLAKTEEQIVTQTQVVANERHSELQLRLTTAKSEFQSLNRHTSFLQQQLDRLQKEAANVFTIRSAYSKLQQDREEAQRQLKFWEENLHKVEMSRTVESDDRGVQLNFIEPARLRPTPVSPQFAQVAMAAIGMGLLGGALCVFLAHRSDDTFMRGQDISNAVNLPLFGSISELVTTRHRRLRLLRNMLVYPTHGAVMGAVVFGLGLMLYQELEQKSASRAVTPVSLPAASVANESPTAALDAPAAAAPTAP